jgi:hypothetical protein
MESVRSYLPPVSAFPVCSAGRLLHRLFRGLLCVYRTLRPADSPSRLKRPSTSEAPATSSPPVPLRLLPGGANQFPGGTFNPRWTSAFHGARANTAIFGLGNAAFFRALPHPNAERLAFLWQNNQRTGKSNTRATAAWLLWRFFLFEEAAEAVNGIGWSFAGVFSDARTETGGTA